MWSRLVQAVVWAAGASLVVFALLWFFVPGGPQPELPRVELRVKGHSVSAEVAQSARQISVGLMGRQSLAADHGMLFVFQEPGQYCFWMANTLVPLTAAFLDESGRIINLADMQPQSRDSHCPERPAVYVLEMNQGWFEIRSLGPGDRVEFPRGDSAWSRPKTL